MCNPASFVLFDPEKQDRVFWSKKTDSHEEIMTEFKLRDGRAGKIEYAKIEINPPPGDDGRPDFFAPAAKWNYRLDEHRAPDWYDAAREERRARKGLAEWINARVYQGMDIGEFSEDSLIWIKDCQCSLNGNAQIAEARGNSKVCELRGNSQVGVLRENSQVGKMHDRTLITTTKIGQVGEINDNGVEVLRDGDNPPQFFVAADKPNKWEKS